MESRTSTFSYRDHKYSGPKKNMKRVRAQLKHHHGAGVTRADVYRTKATPKASNANKKCARENSIKTYPAKHRREHNFNDSDSKTQPFSSKELTLNTNFIVGSALGSHQLTVEKSPSVPEQCYPAFFGVKTEMNLQNDPDFAQAGEDSNQLQEGYYCNGCTNLISGFRYICVQCTDFDLCSACEAKGLHELHYMLRVPGLRPLEEITSVLEKIRQELCTPGIPEDSVKLEIKEEDPLAALEKANINNDAESQIVSSGITTEDTEAHTALNISYGRSHMEVEEFSNFENKNAPSDTSVQPYFAIVNADDDYDIVPNIKVEDDVDKATNYQVFVHKGADPSSTKLMTKTLDLKDPVVTMANVPAKTDQIRTTISVLGVLTTGPQMNNFAAAPGSNPVITSNPQSMRNISTLGPVIMAPQNMPHVTAPAIGDLSSNFVVMPKNRIQETSKFNLRRKR